MRLAFQAMPPESTLWTAHYSEENETVQGTKQELYFVLKMIHIYHTNCVKNIKVKWSRSVVSDSLRPHGL